MLPYTPLQHLLLAACAERGVCALVMTSGMLVSMFLPLITGKKIQRGMIKIQSKDKKWGEIFMTALFLGMISAFLGYVFGGVGEGGEFAYDTEKYSDPAVVSAYHEIMKRLLGE